jgi:hypothetical protein
MNLLLGAAVMTRTNWLRHQGVILPPGTGEYRPLELSNILKLIDKADEMD